MTRLYAFFVGVFIAFVLIVPQARAAYVTTPTVEGLAGGVYKPLTAPALTGSNFAATGKVLVNGKLIPIPGYIPPATTAAQAAKTGLFLNPWVVGASLLAWSGDAGLGSDYVNGGGWTYTDPNITPSTQVATLPTDPTVAGCRSSNGGVSIGVCDASMQACATAYAPLVSGRSCIARRGGVTLGGYASQTTPYTGADAYRNLQVPPYGDCPPGGTFVSGTSACEVAAEPRPATQADFDAMPPPPPEALAELAPQIGLPVDAPVYSPSDVSIGAPYTKPDGSTAEPRAKITPQPDGQVAVDTYDLPLTMPNGDPVTTPTPEDTTETPPTETQCDKYPNSLGCLDVGTLPDAELLPRSSVDVMFAPLSLPLNMTCPAPQVLTFAGHSIPVAYDAICFYADSLRPFVLIVAMLAGAYIIFGVRRGGEE